MARSELPASPALAAATVPLRLALAGTLPPWKGVSPYCLALTRALAATQPAAELTFLDFERLYPALLYPGADMTAGVAAPPVELPANVAHRAVLHYARPDQAFRIGRDLPAEVLHVQFWSEFLAPIFSLLIDGFHSGVGARPRRVVMTVHNLAPHEAAAGLSLTRRLAQRWKEPFGSEVLRRADAWIVHYAAGREELARRLHVDPRRIEVIPHGLLETASGLRRPDGPDGAEASAARTAARKRLRSRLAAPLNEHAPVFLLFGNLRAYKGVEVALRALALGAAPPANGAQLVIAGVPWKDFDLPAMQALTQSLGLNDPLPRVHWLAEFIPEALLADLLAAADALVLPYTRFDAMSGVASLGLRAGLPAIVSRLGGLPDMVPPDCSALVVSPGDPAALAAAFRALLADGDLRRRAARPSAAFLERFAWPAIAAQTRALYTRLLNGAP
ncbi:MAG: glycosyltransferase [Planctomycetota bacterium]